MMPSKFDRLVDELTTVDAGGEMMGTITVYVPCDTTALSLEPMRLPPP